MDGKGTRFWHSLARSRRAEGPRRRISVNPAFKFKMLPGVLLLALLGLTAVAVAIDVAAHRRRTRVLRGLAAQWRMNYHPADQLRITPKVLPRFPIPGAANLHVMDLIYSSDRDRYRYVFSVEFTVGLVGPRRRVVRVASLSEPRERAAGSGAGNTGEGGDGDAGLLSLNLAPAEGTLIDQYRYLAPPGAGATTPDAGPSRESH